MKKFWCILVTTLLLCGNALAAETYAFPSFDMELECTDDAICITRDTKSIDELQIKGTPFENESVKEGINGAIEGFQGLDTSDDTKAVMLVYRNNVFYVVELHVLETDESKEIWDISVMTEKDRKTAEEGGQVSIYEAVSEKQRNLWMLMTNQWQEYSYAAAMTWNNGRMIVVAVCPVHDVMTTKDEEFTKEFLNGIWFTEKRTKNGAAVTETSTTQAGSSQGETTTVQTSETTENKENLFQRIWGWITSIDKWLFNIDKVLRIGYVVLFIPVLIVPCIWNFISNHRKKKDK